MNPEGNSLLVQIDGAPSSQTVQSHPASLAREWRCHCCLKPLPQDQKSVRQCPKCSAPFHAECAARTVLLQSGGFSKCCGDPVITRSMLDLSQDTVVSRLSTELSSSIRQLGDDMRGLIGELKDSIQGLDTRIYTVELHTQEFYQQLERFSSRLQAVEDRPLSSSSPSPTTSAGTTRSDILSSNAYELSRELDERKCRSSNVIVFGAPECSCPDEKLANFNAKLILYGISACAKFVKRLGQNQSGNPRPLKVFLNSSTEAIQVLKHRADFSRDSMQVRNDYTPAQQAHYKSLKEELNTRVQAGEVDLIIRYIRGTQTIVKKRHNPGKLSTSRLRIYYENVRGLRTKLNDLKKSLPQLLEPYDIFILTETWLSSHISDSELGFQNFNVYRCDRSPLTSQFSRAGGVLIALRKTLAVNVLPTDPTLENLLLLISTESSQFILGTIYLPPSGPNESYERYVDIIRHSRLAYPNANVLLTGDYNLPRIAWSNDHLGAFFTPAPETLSLIIRSAEILADCVRELNLFQKNITPNRTGSCLDLVFTSFNNLSVNQAYDFLLPADSFHPPLELSLHSDTASGSRYSSISFRNFKKSDFQAICYNLNLIDWDLVFQSLDLDGSVEFLQNTLNSLIDRHVPKVTFTRDNTFPSWVTPDIKRLIMKKKIAHRHYNKSEHLPLIWNFQDYGPSVDASRVLYINNLSTELNLTYAITPPTSTDT